MTDETRYKHYSYVIEKRSEKDYRCKITATRYTGRWQRSEQAARDDAQNKIDQYTD